MKHKYTIFTTLFGDYEDLNELEIYKRKDTKYLVITDDSGLQSSTWEINVVKPIFPDDPVRSQRYVKIMSHHFLESKYSMYMNSTVKLIVDPIPQFKEVEVKRYGLVFPDHDYRLSVRDEFSEVLNLKLDSKELLMNCFAKIETHNLDVLHQKSYWTGLFFRDMRNLHVQKVMETWAFLVAKYSRRDQLTLNLALNICGFVANRVDFPLLNSHFHKRPVHNNRASNQFEF